VTSFSTANATNPEMEPLFAPFKIKGLELPNRVVMSPMSRYVSPGGIPPADFAAYHRRRAEGGVGLVMTGATGIARPASNNDPNLAVFHSEALPVWQDVVDSVHAASGKIGLQLWHAGSVWNRDTDFRPGPIESPSGINDPWLPASQGMSENDIADTIAAFATAAGTAKAMGFDAIEIHGAHGFLIDQFFWKETNRRNDKWGGETLAERARFGIEVMRAIRRAVGPKFPLFMRISQWKAQDYSARPIETPAELEMWLGPLADAGVDLFHCSQRRFWEPEFEFSEMNLAGWAKKLTGRASMTVGSVGLTGDFFHRGQLRHAALDDLIRRLEAGEFDLVAVGRALLADAAWAEKIREGREAELKPFGREVQETLR